MNRCLSQKQEGVRNSEIVNKFYNSIATDLTERLLKQFKYKKGMDQETILALEKTIKNKINAKSKGHFPTSIFTTYLTKKESNSNDAKFHSQLDSETTISKSKALSIADHHEQTTSKTQISKQADLPQQQEEVDDLAQFENKPVKIKQKVIEVVPQAQIPETPHQQKEQKDSQSSQQQLNTATIQQKMGTAIMGTFSSFLMKRKPKEEKILFQLENVFIKFANSDNEQYFSKILCELIKIQKKAAIIQMKQNQ